LHGEKGKPRKIASIRGAERAHDARREATMRLQGYRIVRVNNVEVYENLDGVLETILAALERRETW
jgi:very-short-patch-repair endonuclease